MSEQQGDVLIEQTNDDGEITVVNGVMTMTPGLGNAAYLSMFGGNIQDSGSDGNPFEYWGNYLTSEPDEKYRSETQYLLNNLPAVTSNIRPIHDAVTRDLNWMIGAGVATSITVEVSLIATNRVQIVIQINGEASSELVYEENWLASINP